MVPTVGKAGDFCRTRLHSPGANLMASFLPLASGTQRFFAKTVLILCCSDICIGSASAGIRLVSLPGARMLFAKMIRKLVSRKHVQLSANSLLVSGSVAKTSCNTKIPYLYAFKLFVYASRLR